MIYTILLYAILAIVAAVQLIACARLGRDIGKWLARRLNP